MRRILPIVLAGSMMCGLCSCGNAETVSAQQDSKIVIWHDKEEPVVAVLDNYLSTKLPDIEVVFEKKASLTDSLKLVGNDPSAAPDMFIFAHDKVGVFAEMGILSPMSEVLPEETWEDYLPMTLSAATYKEELYQVPLYFETLLFLYNEKYMQTEEVPATTNDLLAYMEKNTGRGRYGFVEQHSTAYYSAAWIHGFGGSIIEESGVPFENGDAIKEALEYHLQFVEWMPGETEYNTVNTLFLEGKADATIGGPWMVPSARAAGIELGIAEMPIVDETGLALAPYSGVQGVHVLKNATVSKPEEVKVVLEALMEPTVGVELALASGCAPAHEACYEDERVANDEMVLAMRSTAEIAIPMPNIPEMDVMWTVMSNLLTDVNLSGKEVASSFDVAKKQAEDLIDAMK